MLVAAIFSGVGMVGANLKSGNSVSASSDNREEICDTAYNKLWLDSIPYLIENAKLLKHWAYEALGDCYANGRGGVDKNFMEAISYYMNANVDINEKLSGSKFADEWKTLDKLLNGMDEKTISDKEALVLLSSLPSPRPKWAEYMEKIILSKPKKREKLILSTLPLDLTPEEMMVGVAYLDILDSKYSFNSLLKKPDKNIDLIDRICKKVPAFYNTAARDLWMTIMLHPELAKKYAPLALEFSYEADRKGFLNRHTIMTLMNYIETSGIKECSYFSQEDLNRFRSLFTPKELEELQNVEIFKVVEMTENPVELIEEE